MSRYVLPELPYDYSALEPHLSGKIVELHHDQHHQGYVMGANQAIEQLLEARHHKDFSLLPKLELDLAFHVSGHVLHTLYWQNLSPDGGGKPSGELEFALQRDFGSFDVFKQQLLKAASSIYGSGWAALVWDPVIQRLGTTQIRDHQSQITQGGLPLMVIDVWEHAYYLQYMTNKAAYFEGLFRLWNWDDVERRFELAQRTDLGLYRAATEPEPAVEEHPPLH